MRDIMRQPQAYKGTPYVQAVSLALQNSLRDESNELSKIQRCQNSPFLKMANVQNSQETDILYRKP